MDDTLTQKVLGFKRGVENLETVRNLVLTEAFHHLQRYRRKGEDEVSEFLLQFHGKIEGLLGRFQPMGLPFRHFLLRTIRWQWNTYRGLRARGRRQEMVAVDSGLGAFETDCVAEPEAGWGPAPEQITPVNFSETTRKRLILLALKSAPFLNDRHLEEVSRSTGAEVAWLQGCQHRLREVSETRRKRREQLSTLRGEAFCRRLMAEDDARREPDPERRSAHEYRARYYRSRLASLSKRQKAISTAPTHLELAQVMGMPKGSVDSGLHHLKKALGKVYIHGHDDPPRNEQCPQKR